MSAASFIATSRYRVCLVWSDAGFDLWLAGEPPSGQQGAGLAVAADRYGDCVPLVVGGLTCSLDFGLSGIAKRSDMTMFVGTPQYMGMAFARLRGCVLPLTRLRSA
jgi:hypothetical protein